MLRAGRDLHRPGFFILFSSPTLAKSRPYGPSNCGVGTRYKFREILEAVSGHRAANKEAATRDSGGGLHTLRVTYTSRERY